MSLGGGGLFKPNLQRNEHVSNKCPMQKKNHAKFENGVRKDLLISIFSSPCTQLYTALLYNQ